MDKLSVDQCLCLSRQFVKDLRKAELGNYVFIITQKVNTKSKRHSHIIKIRKVHHYIIIITTGVETKEMVDPQEEEASRAGVKEILSSINYEFNAYISSLDKVLHVFFVIWHSQQLMVVYLVRDGI